jgi:hypothetical protein
VGGDAENVHAAGGVLDDEEDVQPAQGDGVEMEQIAGHDAMRLSSQECSASDFVNQIRFEILCGIPERSDTSLTRGYRRSGASAMTAALSLRIAPVLAVGPARRGSGMRRQRTTS